MFLIVTKVILFATTCSHLRGPKFESQAKQKCCFSVQKFVRHLSLINCDKFYNWTKTSTGRGRGKIKIDTFFSLYPVFKGTPLTSVWAPWYHDDASEEKGRKTLLWHPLWDKPFIGDVWMKVPPFPWYMILSYQ